MNIIGTIALDECPICEQYTLDKEKCCHNVCCSPTFVEEYLDSLAEPEGYYP